MMLNAFHAIFKVLNDARPKSMTLWMRKWNVRRVLPRQEEDAARAWTPVSELRKVGWLYSLAFRDILIR